MTQKDFFIIEETYLRKGIPFVAYTHKNQFSSTGGLGIFRLDKIDVLTGYDEKDRPIVRPMAVSVTQLRRLVKSFKKTTPKFAAFLPDSFQNRAKFREILEKYDTIFLGEKTDVSNDQHGEIPQSD